MSKENLKSLIYLLVITVSLKFVLCKGSEDPFRNPDFLNHDPLIKKNLEDGKINIYETTRDGLKFSFRQVPFNDKLENIKDALDVKININLDDKKQKIHGFGGAFSDSACENLQKLPEKDRDDIIESYFGPNGLEYTLGRTTIGGSDFSSRVYTLDDHENDYELKNFSLTYEDVDYKIPIIKMAMKHQPNLKLIATSWSPPVWLKTNKKINGRGKLTGSDVTGKSYVTYANYFVKFLDAYKKEGINIFAITPANEPNNGRVPFFPFNCIGFTATEMRDFIIKTLGPILKEAGYGKDKLKLYVADDQRIMLKYWVDNIMSNPAAKEFVSGIAFHWYTNSISSPKILSDLHQKYPDLEISSTEACSGAVPFSKHVQIGNWGRGEDYAKDIITDLNHYTNSWFDWNLALNDEGGPNWAKNFVDSPIIINFETKTYIRQPMFYALAHFSKFVKPGSDVLNYKVLSGESKSKDFHFSAFKTENNEVVIVVTNTYNRDVKVSITLENEKDKVFEVLSPKKSIQTYVWKN